MEVTYHRIGQRSEPIEITQAGRRRVGWLKWEVEQALVARDGCSVVDSIRSRAEREVRERCPGAHIVFVELPNLGGGPNGVVEAWSA